MVYHSIAVWDRVLSGSQIAAVRSFTTPVRDLSTDTGPYLGAANLRHWWRFGFDASDVGKDSGMPQCRSTPTSTP